MGLLSSNLKTELQKVGAAAGWVFEVDLHLTPAGPGGFARTTKRYADAGVASWSQGHYDGVMTDAGAGRRAVPLLGSDLQVPITSVTLVDEGRFWAKLIRGPVSRYVEGSPARIYLTSSALASFADSFLETNMVIKSWERRGDYEITLHLQPDMSLLGRAIPDFVITEALYPFADPEVWGKYGPMAYGIYDSAPTNGKGMLPAYCVDRLAFRYLATLGKIEIPKVFTNSEPWTDFIVEYPERGGYDVTEIVFPNGVGEDVLAIDVQVTYDCRGYEAWDGVVITNPASQIAHWLRNFVFGNPTGTTWRKGPWFGTCPLLNVVAGSGWLKVYDYFHARGVSGAHYFPATTQRLGIAALNEWCTSWFAKAFLLNNGTLDIGLFDPSRRRPTTDALYVQESDIWSFQPDDVNGLVRKVMAKHHYDPVANQYRKNLEASDPSVPANRGAFPHELTWGPVNEGGIAQLPSPPSDP